MARRKHQEGTKQTLIAWSIFVVAISLLPLIATAWFSRSDGGKSVLQFLERGELLMIAVAIAGATVYDLTMDLVDAPAGKLEKLSTIPVIGGLFIFAMMAAVGYAEGFVAEPTSTEASRQVSGSVSSMIIFAFFFILVSVTALYGQSLRLIIVEPPMQTSVEPEPEVKK